LKVKPKATAGTKEELEAFGSGDTVAGGGACWAFTATVFLGATQNDKGFLTGSTWKSMDIGNKRPKYATIRCISRSMYPVPDVDDGYGNALWFILLVCCTCVAIGIFTEVQKTQKCCCKRAPGTTDTYSCIHGIADQCKDNRNDITKITKDGNTFSGECT